MNTLLPVGSLLLGRAFVEHVDGPVVTWGKKTKTFVSTGWLIIHARVRLPSSLSMWVRVFAHLCV